MNLRRQLLLVSLLTLVLPWAGCQFIRETESALREGQQQMLSGTAMAIADALSQFPQEFGDASEDGRFGENQIYGHPLSSEPLLDGYLDDWTLKRDSVRVLRGKDGAIEYVVGRYQQNLFLYVNVRDTSVVYRQAGPVSKRQYNDAVSLLSVASDDAITEYLFQTEAPGDHVALVKKNAEMSDEVRIAARWQDTAAGYALEARIPVNLLAARIGIVVRNSDEPDDPGVRSASFSGNLPGRFVSISTALQSVARGYAQPGLRLIITDRTGWRLANAGEISQRADGSSRRSGNGLTKILIDWLLESGAEEALAEPDPSGREQQGYVAAALAANIGREWFRSPDTGRAVVAVARPIWSGNVQTGALVMQQGTDAILSLTNSSLRRLMIFTLIATLVAALGLLGYARWLSGRIRNLSAAAEHALDHEDVRTSLPSALAGDEIGDLSRSFSSVLEQLGEYNSYLRTLAAKLSHELRTPLAIVTSSLENLDHESLGESATAYAARAKDGAKRLQRILSAMSEASRVEELIKGSEPEEFELHAALTSAVAAYGDAWPERIFRYTANAQDVRMRGSPELLIQMLDKLIDNAVDFTGSGDEIVVTLERDDEGLLLAVSNPGPPLPEKMRAQLFDSMVSVRGRGNKHHLGLGLYVARLIAEGHGGNIGAENIADGVRFFVRIPIPSKA